MARGSRRLRRGQSFPMNRDMLEWSEPDVDAAHLQPILIDDEPSAVEEEPAEPGPIIECRGVNKWYGSFQALDDVSFAVEEGEVVVLIGRSGSGKSTLIRCMNRLEPHTSGYISVLGEALTDDQYQLRFIRERVGMVFQEFNLFPLLTVEANVSLGPRLVRHRNKNESRERALTMLDRVGMRDHADKYPSQLSGGEQQRVAIARTLAMEPDIILMDEPTASVDPELTRGIMDLIGEIAGTGVTIVAVTHELGFVRAAADRVLFFDEGQLIEEGPAAAILGDPQHEATRHFVADASLFWTD